MVHVDEIMSCHTIDESMILRMYEYRQGGYYIIDGEKEMVTRKMAHLLLMFSQKDHRYLKETLLTLKEVIHDHVPPEDLLLFFEEGIEKIWDFSLKAIVNEEIKRMRRVFAQTFYREDRSILIEELLKRRDTQYLFAYGTLMKGERHHVYMNDDAFMGEAFLSGYQLYELGKFPGLVKEDGCLLGEIYRVDDQERKMIDQLEGSRYKIAHDFVLTDNEAYYVYFYIYEPPAYRHYPKSYTINGKWTYFTNYRYVWLMCYDVNLSPEHFMTQLDNQLIIPVQEKKKELPYELYFAKKNEKWDGAAAYLDMNKFDSSYAMGYLITRSQYEAIKREYGDSYEEQVLGYDSFGIAEVVLTGRYRYDEEKPSMHYIAEMADGLRLGFQLDEDQLHDYLYYYKKIK
jgi:gamma-glutamylcyclotransferase (GGCT)/AIG2-like uncharacterized protein YtfP